ncbi:hypothetical protein EH228_01365 [Erwinia endophytica]|uniref:hypothetical protein n=1 Tax=Erwinia endophytica TaxID=1563158 RepID=UPI001265FD32|nr:hypothetical protein [Erwinia endophytica]KAB8313724.1 hypothetical protein EH228_01365 [Erwinia endophytica]
MAEVISIFFSLNVSTDYHRNANLRDTVDCLAYQHIRKTFMAALNLDQLQTFCLVARTRRFSATGGTTLLETPLTRELAMLRRDKPANRGLRTLINALQENIASVSLTNRV